MRRSVQPNCPRAMTCCFFASLKMLAMPAEGRTAPPPRQCLERLLPMAGFQVSIYGRFWVSTEDDTARLNSAPTYLTERCRRGLHGHRRLRSLSSIVTDYVRRHRHKVAHERRYFRNLPSFNRAITEAGLARRFDGNRYK